MKRSEMEKILEEKVLNHLVKNAICSNKHLAQAIITELEDNGMLPPKIQGVYDTVPTVTPTGNLDYSFKRGWEKE